MKTGIIVSFVVICTSIWLTVEVAASGRLASVVILISVPDLFLIVWYDFVSNKATVKESSRQTPGI